MVKYLSILTKFNLYCSILFRVAMNKAILSETILLRQFLCKLILV